MATWYADGIVVTCGVLDQWSGDAESFIRRSAMDTAVGLGVAEPKVDMILVATDGEDFIALETYRPNLRPHSLECRVKVFGR
jgi:hypothetical protein